MITTKITTHRVRLRPTPGQETMLFQSADTSRFIYNWTLHKQQENYQNDGTFIFDNVLRKEITQLKKTEDFKWLNDVSCNVAKQVVKDACNAYKRFFKKQSGFPKFKSKKKTRPSFYNDNVTLKVKQGLVLIEKVGWVKTSEQLPMNTKYYNPRITFDNKYWYISVGYDVTYPTVDLTDEVLGIDLGIKDLAICSNGMVFKNINKKAEVKKKEKRLRRLQCKVSRKYHINNRGERFVKTCNIIKIEKEICLLQRTLTNIRKNHIHQATSSIVKTKPRRIVLEDLNVKGMMKNKHLSKAVAQQSFYEFRRQIEYKSERMGIEVVLADRWYPLSKICHSCGAIKKDLKLSDRKYRCDCGYVEDRDLNAALNLAQYGLTV